VQKVAVVVPGFKDNVFLLRIPPVSLKWLGKYIQEISSISAGGRKVDISDLITRVYFQKDQVGVLGFTPASFVDPETAATGDRAYENKATDVLIGKNDRPFTGEVGLPPPAKPAEQGTLAPPPAQSLSERAAAMAAQQTPLPKEENAAAVTRVFNLGQEEPKKPGRPKKEAVAEAPATQAPFMTAPATNGTSGVATAPGDDGLDIPSFLTRTEPAAPPAPPTPKPAGPSFGMQQAQAAPEDMAARITAILGMKT
jgi:hypothetical protein